MTSAATAPATTTADQVPSSPSGSTALASATSAIHHVRARVGRCNTDRADPGTTPARTPPVRPQIISGPAAGTARRLAGIMATGTDPNVGSSTGSAPAWAARVTASGPAIARGPGIADAMRGANSTMPADAPTDSPKPMEPTSNGSTRSTTATARARTRMPSAGRPEVAATQAMAAIAPARTTDGSNRTSTANAPSSASVATMRARLGNQPSSGRASARTNARFWPDTASRCVNPAARKSSASSGG